MQNHHWKVSTGDLMKPKHLVLIAFLLLLLLTKGNTVVSAGSGQTVYDSVNGITTFSQKRILSGSTGWYAYNSSQASSQLDKLGLSIASAYWKCSGGSPAGQVNAYNVCWYNTYVHDYNYGYVSNASNTCGASLKYAGGNHFYEKSGVIDYTWAEHSE